MKFEMPEILYQKYFAKEIDSCLTLMESKDSLLLWDKNFLDDTVGRNICYKKITENRFQRKEILVDLSSDFYFQEQAQLFEVLNEKYGLVEGERSLSILSYLRDSIPFSLDSIPQNKFQLLDEFKKIQKPDSEKVQAFFREPGEYGVDTVLDESLGRYFLSSSQPFMDSNMLQKEGNEKSEARK